MIKSDDDLRRELDSSEAEARRILDLVTSGEMTPEDLAELRGQSHIAVYLPEDFDRAEATGKGSVEE